MYRSKAINEGLREKDLEGLVLPIISIDEYESKIDDTAIVIGFYVQYKAPAVDLNRFIQKSSIDIIDTEVSPAPTEDGYYVVFVEMERNKEFPKKVIELVTTLDNLVDFDEWQFKAVNHEKVFKLNIHTIKKVISLSDTDITSDDDSDIDDDLEDTDESIKEFFKVSILDDLLLEDEIITLKRGILSQNYDIINFGKSEEIREDYISVPLVRLDEQSRRQISTLQRMLGDAWLIEDVSGRILLSHNDSDKMIVLKVL